MLRSYSPTSNPGSPTPLPSRCTPSPGGSAFPSAEASNDSLYAAGAGGDDVWYIGYNQYLAEVAVQRFGDCIEAVMLTTEWYREHMPAFRAAFQHGDILLPRDAEVLDDLRAFKLEKGIAKIPEGARTKDKKGEQRHGDAGIALALAHYASRQEAMVYGYHRVNLRAAFPGTSGTGLGASRPLRIKAGFGLGKGVW